MTEEREVWERIRRGDARAFAAVYREHGPRVQAFLRQALGSRQAAEDVMQETFMQIWQRPNGFESERGTLRAYIFGAARRRAADWWRKNHGGKPSAESERAVRGAETAALIDDAFERLPADQRTLIWLREVEGQSYAELADILGIPVGTVRSRLFTAREELRRIWQMNPKEKKEEA